MAKRRLEAPSPEKLAEMDAEFRSETAPRPNPATAPIAQVAAETAPITAGESTSERLNRLDAEELKIAKEKGLLIAEIPIEKISTQDMVRDRSVIGREELDELILSIQVNGLRLPIEVAQKEDGSYALLSGYRRLLAHQEMAAKDEAIKSIRAIVKSPRGDAQNFIAMVEENEMRENLSHFERGRIAVLAAKEGAFKSTEDAIKMLFFSASKAKRSKIKSFAEVFEAFGDLLSFGEDMSERRGLRLVGALRQGSEDALRRVLGEGTFKSFEDEWAALLPIIEATETPAATKAKKPSIPRGAPMPGWKGSTTLELSSGMTLIKGHDSNGYFIRLKGRAVDTETVEAAMEHLRYLFEKPE